MKRHKRIVVSFFLLLIFLLPSYSIKAQTYGSSQQQSSFDLLTEPEEAPYNSFLITPTPIFINPERCDPKKSELNPIFNLDGHLYGRKNTSWYFIPENPILATIVDVDLNMVIVSLEHLREEDGLPTPTPTTPIPTHIETEPGSQQQGLIIFETPTPFPLPTSENNINSARARKMAAVVRELQKTNFICPIRINAL